MYRTCALPRSGPSALYLPLVQLTAASSRLRTGVSLCHHVTLQPQSHWCHCLFKNDRPIPPHHHHPRFQDILQLSVN